MEIKSILNMTINELLNKLNRNIKDEIKINQYCYITNKSVSNSGCLQCNKRIKGECNDIYPLFPLKENCINYEEYINGYSKKSIGKVIDILVNK